MEYVRARYTKMHAQSSRVKAAVDNYTRQRAGGSCKSGVDKNILRRVIYDSCYEIPKGGGEGAVTRSRGK